MSASAPVEILVVATDGAAATVTAEVWACAAEVLALGPGSRRLVACADTAVDQRLAALAAVAGAGAPDLVLLPHTVRGAELAPALAEQLDAACVTGVEAIRAGAGGLVVSRSVYGGRVRAELMPQAATTVLTVAPGAFPPADDLPAVAATLAAPADAPRRIEEIDCVEAFAGEAALLGAEVVVAGGRGLGGPENVALLERVAGCFVRGAVAGSRPTVDQGWLPYARQVGQTGATVTPRLYLACGISGARQHTVGMRGSDLVIAVNTDPGAAILGEADLVVVQDLAEFLPLLVEEARR